MESEVLFNIENNIAVITLNRPERRNSINKNLLTGLYNALEETADNKDIKAAVITGNGKSFCSGIDLSVIGKENIFDPRGDGKDLPDFFASCKKPVIGAVNGHAITGGFEIALNCDFLIASENAMFADTHARVGIHPGWGMTQLLQQAVGQRMAMQMSMTCQFIDAQTALRAGLVNEVVPHAELMARAMQLAGFICEGKYDMLMTVKELIEFRNNATLEEAYKNERAGFMKFVKKNIPSLKD
jgi:enoyl-CoA hydratase